MNSPAASSVSPRTGSLVPTLDQLPATIGPETTKSPPLGQAEAFCTQCSWGDVEPVSARWSVGGFPSGERETVGILATACATLRQLCLLVCSVEERPDAVDVVECLDKAAHTHPAAPGLAEVGEFLQVLGRLGLPRRAGLSGLGALRVCPLIARKRPPAGAMVLSPL